MFAERVQIRDEDHFVMNAVHDEHGLTDVLQIGEARAPVDRPTPAQSLPRRAGHDISRPERETHR